MAGDDGATKVVQITNIAPQATKDQMQNLFGNIGRIDEIRLYPTIRDVSCPVFSRICYIKYFESSCVAVAQHMTNTVFIDRALIVCPIPNGIMPDEYKALEMTKNGTTISGLYTPDCTLPPDVVNRIDGVHPHQFVTTSDPKLDRYGLPAYPQLPANYDARKIEEIRRTIIVLDIDPDWHLDDLMEFFARAGEVKYCRFADDCGGINGGRRKFVMIEYYEQKSVSAALKLQGSPYMGRELDIYHSNQPIIKPEAKSNEAAQREIEEAMSIVKEAQNMISAAIDPVIGMLSSNKEKTSSSTSTSSRRRSRSRRRSSRSRSRSPTASSKRRSKSRSRKRSRSPRKRSRSPRKRSRSKDRSSRRRSRSRSTKKRSRSRSTGRRNKSPPRSKRSKSRSSRKRSKSRSRKRSKSRTKHSSDSRSSRSKRSRSKDRSSRSKRSSPRRKSQSRSPKRSRRGGGGGGGGGGGVVGGGSRSRSPVDAKRDRRSSRDRHRSHRSSKERSNKSTAVVTESRSSRRPTRSRSKSKGRRSYSKERERTSQSRRHGGSSGGGGGVGSNSSRPASVEPQSTKGNNSSQLKTIVEEKVTRDYDAEENIGLEESSFRQPEPISGSGGTSSNISIPTSKSANSDNMDISNSP